MRLPTKKPPIPPEYQAYFKSLEKKIEETDEVFRIMGKLKEDASGAAEETKSKSSATEDSVQEEKRKPKVLLQSVVKLPAKKMLGKEPLRNLILTDEPRLYMTTTEAYDQIEGTYKKDIMLFI